MKLHTETTGSGPELFLIHGWGMNAAVWSGLREALQADYRITCVDLPGHGRSAAAGDFDLASAADALLEVAPAQAIWIGWSLGGMLALQAAKQAPQRIAQLSLITSSPRFVTAADWPDAVDATVLEQFFTGLQQDYRATLKRFLALQVRGSEAANTTLRDLRQRLFAHGEPDAAALAAGLAILRDADLRPQLGALTMPVQFIMGERDTLMPAAAAFAARALAPHAAVSIIEGAGHVPFVSHPQAFLDALLPFLQAAAPRNTGARHHGG
jgi:pimeloyl-[acyl-carrier protein] methyl ester esterase